MRAVVTAPFHQPVTKVKYRRGDVLFDADLMPLLKFPELLHRLSFTDRTPQVAHAVSNPVVPPKPPTAPLSAHELAPPVKE